MKKYAIFAIFILMAAVCFAADGKFLSDRHIDEYGLECGDCHNENPPAKKMEAVKCFECHESYTALAELTKDAEANPHENHMIYEDTDCGECHRGHKSPALLCDGCHQLDLNIR